MYERTVHIISPHQAMLCLNREEPRAQVKVKPCFDALVGNIAFSGSELPDRQHLAGFLFTRAQGLCLIMVSGT